VEAGQVVEQPGERRGDAMGGRSVSFKFEQISSRTTRKS
jgi:hypothetical protein